MYEIIFITLHNLTNKVIVMDYEDIYNSIKEIFNKLEGSFEYNDKTISFFYDKDMEDYVAAYGIQITDGNLYGIMTLEMLQYDGWGELLSNDIIDVFTKLIMDDKIPMD